MNQSTENTIEAWSESIVHVPIRPLKIFPSLEGPTSRLFYPLQSNIPHIPLPHCFNVNFSHHLRKILFQQCPNRALPQHAPLLAFNHVLLGVEAFPNSCSDSRHAVLIEERDHSVRSMAGGATAKNRQVWPSLSLRLINEEIGRNQGHLLSAFLSGLILTVHYMLW